MEFFDIVDENGNPTGETIERKKAHQNNIMHRTAHVWIARRHEGYVQILLQKRCMQKDSFPGCYDISSAGHIPAGVDYIPSALRELKEELGLVVDESELVECGLRRVQIDEEFHGERFRDNQIAKVFLLWRDVEPEKLSIQHEEIDSVMWINFDECMKAVENDSIPNCIDIEELELLQQNFLN